MSSTSHGVSNSAHQALQEIKNADKEAERVKGISQENKHTIEQLAREVEEASTVINKLHTKTVHLLVVFWMLSAVLPNKPTY